MALETRAEMGNIIDGISERAINALNYGDVTARISRSVEIEPVNGIGLSISQGIDLVDEDARNLADPESSDTVSSDLFPTPTFTDGRGQGLWMYTDGIELWLPNRSQGGTSWHIPHGSGSGFFDPRDLEYTARTEEGYEAKLADIASWAGTRLLDDPTFELLRFRSPFIDDPVAGGEGERPAPRKDEMQEISHFLTFNEEGELTKTWIRFIMQKLAYGSRQYEIISLFPGQDPAESTTHTTRSLDADEVPVTLRGLKRVRAALGRFEEEFVDAA